MIDLQKFTEEKTTIVPIINNRFQYNRKVYNVHSEEGWYTVKIRGNDAEVVKEEFDFSYDTKSVVRGYLYNNKIIFQNFDVAKRKWNLEVSADFNFNRGQSFTSIIAIYWEDKNIYYFGQDYADFKIFEVKNRFDNDEDIKDLKGITNELRTCYLFHKIEKDQLKAMLEAQKREEERKAFMATVPGRLQYTFEQAGAKMTNYSITGKRAVVEWETDGNKYNSVIDLDTFMIIESGFCMSNDDKRHNITSMVKTAEEWEDEGLIYRTRGDERDVHF